MSKRDRSAEAWEAISQLRVETDSKRLVEAILPHLMNKAGVVVAKAMQLILDRQDDLEPHVEILSPAMASAFDRFMLDPVKSDPGCGAKIGIVNAGVAFHCLDADVYLRAIRHVQMEGSFGPPIDTAEALRAGAAYGLLNSRHADAMYEIIELLNEVDPKYPDRFPDSRRGAIRALGTVVSDTSAAVLRMAALRYRREAETLSEIFTSLNSIEAGRSFDFIAGFMNDSDPDVQDMAALAVAESKQPRACAVLLRHAKRNIRESAQAIFTALAITRKPDAIDFLIDRLGNGREPEAIDALSALQLMRHDDAVRERIKRIISGRGDAALRVALDKW